MEFLNSNSQIIQIRSNIWYQNPNKDLIEGFKINNFKNLNNNLNYLTNSLTILLQDNLITRIKSEFILYNKILNTSRYQIRSYKYLSLIKKFKQLIKKLLNLNINENISKFLHENCSINKLIDLNSLHSIQWRILSAILLTKEIELYSKFLVERLTQELTLTVFLHYPIAFISLSSSLSNLSCSYQLILFNLFCKLITFEKKKILPFPINEIDNFPLIPFDETLIIETSLNLDQLNLIDNNKQNISKINLSLNLKPSVNQRNNNSKIINKQPISALSNLGF